VSSLDILSRRSRFRMHTEHQIGRLLEVLVVPVRFWHVQIITQITVEFRLLHPLSVFVGMSLVFEAYRLFSIVLHA
jgi:hypothetical protein